MLKGKKLPASVVQQLDPLNGAIAPQLFNPHTRSSAQSISSSHPPSPNAQGL